MAKLLLIGTHGTDEPTRATMPYHFAKGAVEAGYDAAIVLAGDAASLLRPEVRDAIRGVGMPALTELETFAREHEVPVFV